VPSETGSNNAGKGDNQFKNSAPIDIKVEYLRPMQTNAAGSGGNRLRSDSGDQHTVETVANNNVNPNF
jgi:hypothetical protein